MAGPWNLLTFSWMFDDDSTVQQIHTMLEETPDLLLSHTVYQAELFSRMRCLGFEHSHEDHSSVEFFSVVNMQWLNMN